MENPVEKRHIIKVPKGMIMWTVKRPGGKVFQVAGRAGALMIQEQEGVRQGEFRELGEGCIDLHKDFTLSKVGIWFALYCDVSGWLRPGMVMWSSGAAFANM